MFKAGFLERASEKIDKCLWKYPSGSWRGLSSFFFWTLGAPFAFNPAMKPISDETCRIACIMGGGLGDILISLNYLKNLDDCLSGKRLIDVYPGHKDKFLDELQSLCRGQNFIHNVGSTKSFRRDYDIVFELFRFPKLLYCNKHKISKLSGCVNQWTSVLENFLKESPFFFRTSTPAESLGLRYTLLNERHRLAQADIQNLLNVKSKLELKSLGDVAATRKKFFLDSAPFITFQRGIGSRDPNNSTRLWPLSYYEELVRMLKKQYPGMIMVQLGSESNLPISSIDVDLRGRTNFEELKNLLSTAVCHIDGECGMVHLRHFLHGGPSVVLFGVTSEQLLGYPENINLKSDICPGGCEWLTTTYNRKCARGFSENQCMTSLKPQFVFEKTVSQLDVFLAEAVPSVSDDV